MESNSVVQDRFLLMTGTLGFGHAPARVQRFLELNANNCIGVVASGNRNWGQNFAGAANEINRLYGIPIIMKFELSGTTEEVNLFKKKVAKLFNGK
jgi:protein involved in ribonucleotide reduction